jgi:hypothetical protein
MGAFALFEPDAIQQPDSARAGIARGPAAFKCEL